MVSPSENVPISIEREGEDAIVIRWNDGAVSNWTVSELRRACPCATCRDQRRNGSQQPDSSAGLPILSAAEAQPLRINGMKPVGNYAYSIAFSDDHTSGVYPFDLLRKS